jgi:hypothetical protein
VPVMSPSPSPSSSPSPLPDDPPESPSPSPVVPPESPSPSPASLGGCPEPSAQARRAAAGRRAATRRGTCFILLKGFSHASPQAPDGRLRTRPSSASRLSLRESGLARALFFLCWAMHQAAWLNSPRSFVDLRDAGSSGFRPSPIGARLSRYASSLLGLCASYPFVGSELPFLRQCSASRRCAPANSAERTDQSGCARRLGNSGRLSHRGVR